MKINFIKQKILNRDMTPFHLVSRSPWPFLVAISVLQTVLSLLFWFTVGSTTILYFSILQLFFFQSHWFYDIIIESTFEGCHTRAVQRNVRFAMLLFILSEIMFFFSFFWGFFHFSVSPSIWIGNIWPPKHISYINFKGLPLLNTLLLLSSGVSITYAHRIILSGNYKKFAFALVITIWFGLIFLYCQYFEYNHAQFDITTSVYGSIFYLMTGFHGLHVIVGLIFLLVCLFRAYRFHFTREHHVGLECAIWYWHFVDVVWVLLYLVVYVHGSKVR